MVADEGAAGGVKIGASSSMIFIGEETTEYDGSAVVKLTRGLGAFGDVRVHWEIIPSDANTFVSTEGNC